MSDISFAAEGVFLDMNYLGCDPNDRGSTRWSVKLVLLHSAGHYTYEANDIWFEAQMWDDFASALSSTNKVSMKFSDMSDYFILSLKRTPNCVEVYIKVYEPVNRKDSMKLDVQLETEIDADFIGKLDFAFESFPKPW